MRIREQIRSNGEKLKEHTILKTLLITLKSMKQWRKIESVYLPELLYCRVQVQKQWRKIERLSGGKSIMPEPRAVKQWRKIERPRTRVKGC